MRALGRFLQLVGFVALPLGMVLEMSKALGRAFGLSQMIWMLLFGVIAFYLGRMIEGIANEGEAK